MGLFGGLFKVIGKVARAGLSSATHGASEQVLKVLKGRGGPKQVIAKQGMPATNQEKALVNKLLPIEPRLKTTERVLAGVNALDHRRRKMGPVITKVMKGDVWRSRGGRTEEELRKIGATQVEIDLLRKGRGAQASAGRVSAGGGVRASSGKRKPPPGGLDLKRMAVAWRAAGKPGRWIDWIKSRPLRRP